MPWSFEPSTRRRRTAAIAITIVGNVHRAGCVVRFAPCAGRSGSSFSIVIPGEPCRGCINRSSPVMAKPKYKSIWQQFGADTTLATL